MSTNRLTTRLQNAALLAMVVVVLSACTGLPACHAPAGSSAELLIGRWTAQVQGDSQPWALVLAPHPEHLGSLRGELSQGLHTFPVVADLDDGEFTMEESHDGQSIAATWLGRLPHTSCPFQIQGERILRNQSRQSFDLKRVPE